MNAVQFCVKWMSESEAQELINSLFYTVTVAAVQPCWILQTGLVRCSRGSETVWDKSYEIWNHPPLLTIFLSCLPSGVHKLQVMNFCFNTQIYLIVYALAMRSRWLSVVASSEKIKIHIVNPWNQIYSNQKTKKVWTGHFWGRRWYSMILKALFFLYVTVNLTVSNIQSLINNHSTKMYCIISC